MRTKNNLIFKKTFVDHEGHKSMGPDPQKSLGQVVNTFFITQPEEDFIANHN